jgi:hypothetical protein
MWNPARSAFSRNRRVDTVNLEVYTANMDTRQAILALAIGSSLLLTLSFALPGEAASAQAAAASPGGMPFSRLLAPEQLTGEVVELLPAGSYLYVRLREPGGGTIWVATLREALALGPAEVTVFGWREAFVSRRLDRTFERLAFGVVHPRPAPLRP